MKDQTPAPAPRLVITLTPAQQRNLLAFLQRASLTGRDVPAYNEVVALIQRAGPSASQSAIKDQQSSNPSIP